MRFEKMGYSEEYKTNKKELCHVCCQELMDDWNFCPYCGKERKYIEKSNWVEEIYFHHKKMILEEQVSVPCKKMYKLIMGLLNLGFSFNDIVTDGMPSDLDIFSMKRCFDDICQMLKEGKFQWDSFVEISSLDLTMVNGANMTAALGMPVHNRECKQQEPCDETFMIRIFTDEDKKNPATAELRNALRTLLDGESLEIGKSEKYTAVRGYATGIYKYFCVKNNEKILHLDHMIIPKPDVRVEAFGKVFWHRFFDPQITLFCGIKRTFTDKNENEFGYYKLNEAPFTFEIVCGETSANVLCSKNGWTVCQGLQKIAEIRCLEADERLCDTVNGFEQKTCFEFEIAEHVTNDLLSMILVIPVLGF